MPDAAADGGFAECRRGTPGIAIAQGTRTAATLQPLVCEPGGLIGGATLGGQLLVRTTVSAFPAGAVFWHLRSFETLADAERAACRRMSMPRQAGDSATFR